MLLAVRVLFVGGFEEESGLDFSSVFCFFCLFVWNKEFLVRVPTKGVSLSRNNRGTIDT